MCCPISIEFGLFAILSPSPTSVVNTTTIFYDGTGSQEPDEDREITINNTKPIQLRNRTLSHAASHALTFSSFVFQPVQVFQVCTNDVHLGGVDLAMEAIDLTRIFVGSKFQPGNISSISLWWIEFTSASQKLAKTCSMDIN